MRVGWLHDGGNMDGTQGGAELTQAEFRAAAPEDVEVVDCPAGGVVPDLDRYVAHNVVFYAASDLRVAEGKLVKYWHDVGPHMLPEVAAIIREGAQHICCSPVQRERLGLDDPDRLPPAEVVPPALPLGRFREAAATRNGRPRVGVVSLGPWMNHGKDPRLVFEWAQGREVDFYGRGPLAPQGARQVDYDLLPDLLARYETFVHLPLVLEPFGRGVVEAWAAGCNIVTNGLVGARWWITEKPDALETAAEDFWRVVTE